MLRMIIYCNYKNNNEFGANLCYYYNSCFLSEQPNAKAMPFPDILRKIKNFNDEDVLLTNSGPYDWIFHYFRKKHNKNFTIVRDVHTTLWGGYLLQEKLCSKYSNENDRLIIPSEFTRQFYIKLFSHLNEENTSVCFPVMHSFQNHPKIEKHKQENKIVLGWLGHLSKEKNFDQALQIFIESSKLLKDKNIQFLACGKPQAEYSRDRIIPLLNKHKIDQRNYIHINEGKPIPHQGIWEFLKNIDILLFPSTANIESCPTVLVEANHMSIPIIASEHGGGYNVVPKENLVKTTYFSKSTDLINNQPLGKIDIAEAVQKVENYHKLKLNKNIICKDHDKKLLEILNNQKTREKAELDNKTKEFIKNTDLFLNKKYREDIRKAIKILLINNHYDIGNTAYKIANGLNFKVYAKFNNL